MGLCGCVESSSFYLSNLALQRVRSRIVTHERLAADKFAHHRNQKSANTPTLSNARTYVPISVAAQGNPRACKIFCVFSSEASDNTWLCRCSASSIPNGGRSKMSSTNSWYLAFAVFIGQTSLGPWRRHQPCTHEGARVLYANIRPCSWLSAWVPLSVCDPERVRMYAAVVRAGGSQRHNNWREDGSVGGPAQNSSQPKTRR